MCVSVRAWKTCTWAWGLTKTTLTTRLEQEQTNNVWEEMSSSATYGQEVEAIEAILSKANVLLREFEDRERNVKSQVCFSQLAIFVYFVNFVFFFFFIFVSKKFFLSHINHTHLECQFTILHFYVGRHEEQINCHDPVVSYKY